MKSINTRILVGESIMRRIPCFVENNHLVTIVFYKFLLLGIVIKSLFFRNSKKYLNLRA